MKKLNAQTLLERTLDMPLPQIAGCHDILIIGETASGKTTMLKRVKDNLPSELVVDILTETRELEEMKESVRGYHEMPRHVAGGGVDISKLSNADVLIVSEVLKSAQVAILDAIADNNGPSIISTFCDSSHGRQPNDILDVLQSIASRGVRKPRVAVVRMKRSDKDGKRIVDFVTAL